MLWERLTFSDRFEFVDQKKIVHVVMDDAVDKKKIASDEWYHELKQTDIGVQRVKTWSQFDEHLEDGDIFISADVDEVMSGAALHQLRWCETKQVRGQGAVARIVQDHETVSNTGMKFQTKVHRYQNNR